MLILQFISCVAIVALDQFVKLWCVNVLEPIGKIPVIEGVFNLRFVENTGAAFSMLRGNTVFLIIVPALAAAFMFYLLLLLVVTQMHQTRSISLTYHLRIANMNI